MKAQKMAIRNPQIRMNLDAQFKISVPSDTVQKLMLEISKGEACMSVKVPYGDGIEYMLSVYIDHFKDGDMKILSYDNGMANFIVRGQVILDLDPNFDAEFIQALKEEGAISVKCTDVCDNDVTNYYIDGNDEINLNIGECALNS